MHSNTSSTHVKKKDVSNPTVITRKSQTIFKPIYDKNHPFVQLSLKTFSYGLSGDSISLLSYLLSNVNHWKYYLTKIKEHFSHGRDWVRAHCNELEEKGFIYRGGPLANKKSKNRVFLVYGLPEHNPYHESYSAKSATEAAAWHVARNDHTENPTDDHTENPTLTKVNSNKINLNNNSNNRDPEPAVAIVDEKYSKRKIRINLAAMARDGDIPKDTDIEEKVSWVYWMVTHRDHLKTKSDKHAYNFAVQALKRGDLDKPKGMLNEDSIAREQAAQREKLQEIKEGKGMLHQLIAQSALAPTFTPDAEKNISDLKNLLAGINANRTKEPLRARG